MLKGPYQKKKKKKVGKPTGGVAANKKRIAATRKKRAAARAAAKQKRVDKLAKKRTVAKKAGKHGKVASTQNKINKKLGVKKRHTKASVKKKSDANKSWAKAVSARPKGGATMGTLVSRRKKYKKGSSEYKKIQSEINRRYGVKKKTKK